MRHQHQAAALFLAEDLRAFLELIQRVQARANQAEPALFAAFLRLEVLEVERLELEHFWEVDRQQLEQSDQDTGTAAC